jgi:superfamily II DNA or RNA helicase
MTLQVEQECKLPQLEAECARLREENRQLRERLSLPPDAPARCVPADATASLNQTSPTREKIELFQQLFRGREDVYPVRWETATPVRKDGHHPIILMHCGPIRYWVATRKQHEGASIIHRVVPRETGFFLPENDSEAGIQALYAELASSEARNALIFNDVLQNLEEGRSPLLLTERTDYLEWFERYFKTFARNIVVPRGGLGKKAQREIAERLASVPPNEERLIIATGRYIGEGFDDIRLDTLFLTLPISWRGTLQQYVGRLHRQHEGKHELRVYDYVIRSTTAPACSQQYRSRQAGR